MTLNPSIEPADFLPEETLTKKFLSKGFWAYFFMFIAAPAGYLIRLIVSNTLAVEDIGIIYSIIGLIGLVSVYNDLGLTEALQYYLPKYRIEKQYNAFKTLIISTFTMQLATGILIGSLMYRGAERIGTHYFKTEQAVPILRIFCLYFLGVNFLQVINSLATAFQDTFYQQLGDVCRLVSILALTAWLWLSGTMSSQGFAWSWIIGLAIGITIAGFLLWRKYRSIWNQGQFERELPIIKEQLRYALRVFLGANIGTLYGQIDLQSITFFLGSYSAGLYSNFQSLFMIYVMFTGPLIGLLFPIATELWAKKNTEKFGLILKIFYTYFGLFSLSLGGLFAVLGPQIGTLLMGNNYFVSGQLLQFGGIWIPFAVICAINFSLLAGIGQAKQRVKILGWALGINIILNIILIHIRGMYGVIAATGISRGYLAWTSYWIIAKHTGSSLLAHVDRPLIFRNSLLIILLCTGIWWFKSQLFDPNNTRIINLGMLVFIGIGYYLILAGANISSLRSMLRMIKG